MTRPLTGLISYLVKWKGYSKNDNNWVPRTNLYPKSIEEHEKRVGACLCIDTMSTSTTGGSDVQNVTSHPCRKEMSGSTWLGRTHKEGKTSVSRTIGGQSSPSAKNDRTTRVKATVYACVRVNRFTTSLDFDILGLFLKQIPPKSST